MSAEREGYRTKLERKTLSVGIAVGNSSKRGYRFQFLLVPPQKRRHIPFRRDEKFRRVARRKILLFPQILHGADDVAEHAFFLQLFRDGGVEPDRVGELLVERDFFDVHFVAKKGEEFFVPP